MTTNDANSDGRQTTGEGTTPSVPTASLPRSDRELLDEWLNNTYRRYPLEDGTEAIITVQELLDIVCTEVPECLIPDQTLTLSLELARKKWNRSNTVIISDINAQSLYHLGTGRDMRAEVLASCPALLPTLSKSEKRWTIIPCNDGFQQAAGIGEAYKEAALANDEAAAASAHAQADEPTRERGRTAVPEEVQSNTRVLRSSTQARDNESQRQLNDANKEQTTGTRLHGAHWGLLIIDKTEKVACWVDSYIKLERRSGYHNRFKMTMLPAAIVAGKVLCGFDTLLGEKNGFPTGGFTTSTLEYVPQQWDNNNYIGVDGGPCGPFTFAFLEHIFERATLLDRVGLRKMFPRSKQNRLKFNSMHARQEMRRLIQQESEQPDAMPLQLSLDLLRILNILSVDNVQRAVDAYRNKEVTPAMPTSSKRTALPASFKPDPTFLAAFEQDKVDNPEAYEDCAEDDEALMVFYTLQRSMDAHANSANGKNKESNITDIYLGRHLYRNVPLDNPTVWPAPETDQSIWPRTFRQLPDFATLKSLPLASWVNKNKEVRDHMDTDKKHSNTTTRAMLHVKFKKTFLAEPDNNFKAVWIHDQTVFNPHDPNYVTITELEDNNIKYGKLRLMMMRHYESDRLSNVLKELRKYRVETAAPDVNNSDSGGDDSGSADDGENNQGGMDNEIGDDLGQGGNQNGEPTDGDTFHYEYQNRTESHNNQADSAEGSDSGDNNSGSKNNVSGNNNADGSDDNGKENSGREKTNDVSLTTPIPRGLLDFRTMPEGELMTYVTSEMRDDPRVDIRHGDTRIEPNHVSWRALCFVDIGKRRFDNESDHDCQSLWFHDPLVFSEFQQQMVFTGAEIMNFMGNYYHPEKPTEKEEPQRREGLSFQPDFNDNATKDFDGLGSETEEDPDLHESTADKQQDSTNASTSAGTKRKHGTGEVSRAKRPRISDNFLTMSEGALASRVRDMPPIFGNELLDGRRELLEAKHVGHARVWLERMYGDGFEYMRNEDPLSDTSMTELNKWKFMLKKSYRKDQRGMRQFLEKILLKDPTIDGEVRLLGKQEQAESTEGISAAPKETTEGAAGSRKQPPSDSSTQQVTSTNGDPVTSAVGDNENSLDASSPLSSVPDSEDESDQESPSEDESSSESDGSESDDNSGRPDNSDKRRRDSEDSSRDEAHTSKKRRTNDTSLSNHSEVESDTDSNIDLNPPVPTEGVEEATPTDLPVSGTNTSPSSDSQATLADSAVETYVGRDVYFLDSSDSSIFLPWDDTRTGWPDGVTSLPDFATMGGIDGRLWQIANPDIVFKSIGNFTTYLAQLHMRFKRTWLHESNTNLVAVWVRDQSVFSPALRGELSSIGDLNIRSGEIRRRMMEAYEPEMLRRIESMPKPRPANPNITAHTGAFDDPESFNSNVHIGRTGRPGRSIQVDDSRLAPAPAGRYALRKDRKPSWKQLENAEVV